MSWMYKQSTGEMTNPDGSISWNGYSGAGDGLNNPDMQDVEKVGPIPVGTYTIGEAYDEPGKLGPCVLPLTPAEDNEMFGRSLFRIHGDNPTHTASEGCIIQGPQCRHTISSSTDKILVVVS